MQDWCPRDQLLVNGGICQVGLPKGRVIIREGWGKYVSNDVGKGYVSYPPDVGQDHPGFVKGLSGRGKVKGNGVVVGPLLPRRHSSSSCFWVLRSMLVSRFTLTSGAAGMPISRWVRSWCLIQNMASLSCVPDILAMAWVRQIALMCC
jgi:hypothetical protein